MNLLTAYNSPGWLVAVLVAVSVLLAVVGMPLARRAGQLRAQRLRHPENYATRRDRAKDNALFLAALLPSILVWLSVMGVSFKGLTGFASDYMRWNDWTNIIVPLSLDGISVAFGAHAFRAVNRGRYPGRANKIVLAAAATSAVLNFVHARDVWSTWAGVYLAFMSVVGMAMFHEMLEQFSDVDIDEQELRSRTPRFGKRWLLAPLNTFLVWRMWIYDPPADRRKATVRNALDHYAETKTRRRQHAQELADLATRERRARIERNAELAQARLAAQQTVQLAGARATAANSHERRLSATAAIPATRVDRAGAAPVAPQADGSDLAVPDTRQRRELTARWAPEAKQLVTQRLEQGERISAAVLRDLIAERVAAKEGVAWRPSDIWARAILREVRDELAHPGGARRGEGSPQSSPERAHSARPGPLTRPRPSRNS